MRTEVLIAGEGGQGVRLVGLLLARICAAEGKNVACSASYGAEKSGSKCWSEIIISDEPVDYPKVLEADFMVSMMQEAHEFLLTRLKCGALILYDPLLVSNPRPTGSERSMEIKAVEHALRRFNDGRLANFILLGAIVSKGSFASNEAGVNVVKSHVAKAKASEAFSYGYDLGVGDPV